MKMGRLIAAAVVLAALAATLYWSNHRAPPVVACLAASKQYFERTVAEVWWQNRLGRRRAVSFGAGPAL